MGTAVGMELLSKLENWKICEQGLDVRGWKLVDDAGNSLGVVRDLMVNTETESVETVVLDTLAEYPARELELEDNLLRLRRDEFMTGSGGAATSHERLRIRCSRT
jgi:hypothetical protein